MKRFSVCRLFCLLLIVAAFPVNAAPPQAADTLNILAIRVQFQQDTDATTTGDGLFDLGMSTDPFQIDPPPHNRAYFEDHLLFAKNYFEKVSRGNLVVNSDVFPQDSDAAYQLSGDMKSYNPNTSTDAVNEGISRLLRDALTLADADPDVDFRDYNTFIVFHAGVGKDVDLGFDSTPQDIPSLFITQDFLQQTLGVDGFSVQNGAVTVTRGILLPETESQEGIQLGLNGILVSNIASQLGFLDLFSPDDRRSGIGRFGLMDAGLFNGDGLLPALPSAWTRIEAGWETATDITQSLDDEFTVASTLTDNADRVFRVPINEREYFLVENRYAGPVNLDSLQIVISRERNEFPSMKEILLTGVPNAVTFSQTTGVLTDIDNPDRGLPGGGILIWHIDENIIDANRASNRINNDPANRGVDLEEADGSQDIGAEFEFLSGGAGSEIGTSLDPWYATNSAPLFTDDPAGTFDLGSVPSSRSNVNRANSHIKIFDFSGRSSEMTFRVNLDFFELGFPKRIDTAFLGAIKSMKVFDTDANGADELIMTTDDGYLLIMDKDGQNPWSSTLASLQVALAPDFIYPPAILQLSDNNVAIALLTAQGTVAILRLDRSTQTSQGFSVALLPDSITTFPIGFTGEDRFLFGTDAGDLQEISYDAGGGFFTLSVLSNAGQKIKKLHVAADGEPILVLDDNSLFNGESLPGAISQPVGRQGVAGTEAGELLTLGNNEFTQASANTFAFDSPVIEIPLGVGDTQYYIVNGNNRVLVYNYNFSLRSDFPLSLFNPDQPVKMSFSPMTAPLRGVSGPTNGIITSDPGGLIGAYDFEGNVLPDFPIAIGDSMDAHPVFLDIDGDGNGELAAVTRNGVVLVYDFPSDYSAGSNNYWTQQYGNALNSNFLTGALGFETASDAGVLPEKSVYNWPNPNTDNYTFIRYRLNDAADVSIRIFDLAGDLVTELEGTGNPNTDNEVRWDLSSVQSGVYLARVEASGGNGKETRIIKIAVVK
ncbi:MAG: T9SS type A sorting domain-containing protein [Calditrichia bacterium]